MGALHGIRLALLVSTVAVVEARAMGAGQSIPEGARPAVPVQTASIGVSVATVWAEPYRLRAVDAPSASVPVDLRRWLGGMTVSDQRWLVGRVHTQALYGSPVKILARNGAWTRVAVEGQATPLNPLGYPGWVPTRQLARSPLFVKAAGTHPTAVVTRRSAWLRDPASLAPVLEVSFATRLVVVGTRGGIAMVATPAGGKLAIAGGDVAVYPSVRAIPRPTGAAIVSTATTFLGLPYLWGGTSGFGFDCSGFTYSVYRRYGIDMPRDADRQALHGSPVARAALRPGDLVFFTGAGGTRHIEHVGLYVGAGKMIHAPDVGQAIGIISVASFGSRYAGARRYL